MERSVSEARRLAAAARRKARGYGAQAKLNAAAGLEDPADRCEKVSKQIRQRVAGERITDRIVSLSDPDARPIRKGKLGRPNEFGYVVQLAEVTENTKPGERGLILPASSQLGHPHENTLLPSTVAELARLGLRPREVALDGGFQPGPSNGALADLAPKDGVQSWPPGTSLQTHQAPAGALPPGRGRPDQPPQTLRVADGSVPIVEVVPPIVEIHSDGRSRVEWLHSQPCHLLLGRYVTVKLTLTDEVVLDLDGKGGQAPVALDLAEAGLGFEHAGGGPAQAHVA